MLRITAPHTLYLARGVLFFFVCEPACHIKLPACRLLCCVLGVIWPRPFVSFLLVRLFVHELFHSACPWWFSDHALGCGESLHKGCRMCLYSQPRHCVLSSTERCGCRYIQLTAEPLKNTTQHNRHVQHMRSRLKKK